MATQLPEDYPITAEMREWAAKKCPTLDIEYYHEEFCDHWEANGKKKASWFATWRNWMRRTDTGTAPGVYLDRVKRIPLKLHKNVVKIDSKFFLLDQLRARALNSGAPKQQVMGMGLAELREKYG